MALVAMGSPKNTLPPRPTNAAVSSPAFGVRGAGGAALQVFLYVSRPCSTARTLVQSCRRRGPSSGGVLVPFSTSFSHGHTNIGALQRRRVIDAVAGYGNHLAASFSDFDDA